MEQLGEKDTDLMSLQRKKDDMVDTTNNLQADNVKIGPANKMRSLVKKIYQSVINPYQKERNEIEEQYVKDTNIIDKQLEEEKSVFDKKSEVANSRARAEVDRLNKRFEENESVINKEIQEAKSKVKSRADSLDKMLREAGTMSYMHSHKMKISKDGLSLDAQHDNTEKKAQFYYSSAQSALESIGSVEKPWDGFAQFFAGLGVFIVTAITWGVLDHLPGYFVFVAPLFVLLQPHLAKGKRQKYVSKLRESAIATRHCLELWLEQVCKEAEEKRSYEQRAASAERMHLDKKFQEPRIDLRNQIAFEEEAANVERKRLDEGWRDSLTELQKRFTLVLDDLRGQITRFTEEIGVTGAVWDASIWRQWAPASTLIPAVRLGRLSITSDVLSELGSKELSLPALIPFNGNGRSLLFDASDSARSAAVAAVEGFILRLLATLPPGNLRLIFIDPVKLGQQVAGFMHLAEHDKSLITGKVLTDPSHIEQGLTELKKEHVENVIQNKLRTEHATIEDYNGKVGKTAEPYRLLVVMDFPANFTDAALRHLVSIAENGPRCGVHTVIVAGHDKSWPYGFTLADFKKNATVFKSDGDHFVWQDRDFKSCRLELDERPPNDLVERVIEAIGPLAVDAMKVEVPFESLSERYHVGANTGWEDDVTTQNGIEIPLGPGAQTNQGVQTNQLFKLGVGMEHHALIVGRPGSGKSNLMHVIITGMALKYPPSELELYLVDFKGGVEFKPYATHRLPHARAVAIESEREFGISILRHLRDEMGKREVAFRNAGVDDLTSFRAQGNDMPRIVLLVDEFQDFFAEEDDIKREADDIFSSLIKKARSAGIHIILCSQSLRGKNSLSNTTVDLITIRIALQCSDADSREILTEGNSAARMLMRPGQAIYNDKGGLPEGNSEFQVALCTAHDRLDYLTMILSWARAAKGREAKFIEDSKLTVFEGNELPHIRVCKPLMELLSTEAPIKSSPHATTLWLGEAIAIRQPVSLLLCKQSEKNILIVTRAEEEGAGLCLLTQISFLAQQREGVIYNFDLTTTADTAWAKHAGAIRDRYGSDRIQMPDRCNIKSVLTEVVREIQNRIDVGGSDGGVPILVVFQGLHQIRNLLGEGANQFELENDSPRVLLAKILKDGPGVGVHTIVWVDTLTNARRCLDYEVVRLEFGFRIAGALSREDSQDLLNAPDASQIRKSNRFLLFGEERPDDLTLFRPYAIPDLDGLRDLLASKINP